MTRTVFAALALSLLLPGLGRSDVGKVYWIENDRIMRADGDGQRIEEVLAPQVFFCSRFCGRSFQFVLDPDSDFLYAFVEGSIERHHPDRRPHETLFSSLPSLDDLAIASGKLYWSESANGRVRRANLDGSALETILSGLAGPTRLWLDGASGKIYLADAGDLKRANLNGTALETLIAGIGPKLVDLVAGKVYWKPVLTELHRSDLDGAQPELMFSSQELWGGDLFEIDAAAGKIYWPRDQFGDVEPSRLYRANLDGSMQELLVENLLEVDGIYHDFQLDLLLGKVYWFLNARIERADLDGTDVEAVTGWAGTPKEVAVDSVGEKLYWTTDVLPGVQRSNLDGSAVVSLTRGGIFIGDPIPPVFGLALDPAQSRFFWVETDFADASGRIFQAPPLGTGTPVTTPRNNLHYMDYDPVEDKIYWTSLQGLERSDPDGQNLEVLWGSIPAGRVDVVGNPPVVYWSDPTDPPSGSKIYVADPVPRVVVNATGLRGFAVDLQGDKIYFADDAGLQRSDLEGANPELIVPGDIGSVALFTGPPEPIPLLPAWAGTVLGLLLAAGGYRCSATASLSKPQRRG